IENVPMATFDNILQGSAPGLSVQSGTGQPGRAASLNIRGIKSFALSTQPLFIMDGQAISQSDFAGINPNDIESVSVLKDAAATQIYGSRGSSGVIVITTKSGKQGKARLEYRTYTGVSIAPDYNEALEPLSSGQLIDLSQEIGIGGVVNVGATEDEITELRKYSEDWLGVLTRNGMTNSHEITLSGGNESTRFFISGGYFSQEGIALRSRLDRYSLRTKVDYNTDRFRVGANVYLSYSDIEDSESEGRFSRSNPFYASIRTPAYDRAIDPETGGYAAPLDPSQSSVWNNLERVETNDEDRAIGKAIVSLNGHYEFGFLDGLSFDTNFNMDYSQRNNRTYVDPTSVDGGRRQGGQGSLDHSFTDDVAFTITNSLHYNFDVKDDHLFDVRLYQEYVANDFKNVGLTVYGLNQLTTIDGATEGSETNGFIPSFRGSTSRSTLSSYFATLDYSYLKKYNVTAGFRRDGSSRFGENYAFGNFYSVGLGWVVSEENFLSSIESLNYLKLRASYGTVGNQRISSTAARSVFGTTSYNGISGTFAGLSNPDLKWEETAKANVGIDMTVLGNRLNFTIDAYSEKTTDLFQNVPLSRTTGFGSQLRNVGSLKNEGLELAISGLLVDKKNFKWESSFNAATNETTILELNNGESFRSGRFLIEEGGSYPEFNLVKRAGVNPANGRYLWYDLDGNLTETYDLNNRVNVGRATPRYTGGFLNTITSGGFELRALFSFSEGKKIYNVARTSLDNPSKISRGSVSTNALRFWRQPGDITDIPDPRQISNYFTDSGWLEDASFIKLRNVTLSYNFPESALDRMKLSGLRLYLQGQNIYTWTSFSGLDPENSSSEYVADYPALSTYTFGIEAKL
ncbi:MAG: SusC/RagA family TonB-linked outer membrane protein, partial [Flavobacteriaceae bacterium]